MQTTDFVRAAYLASKNAVVGTLTLQSYRRSIINISIDGAPSNSKLAIYRGLDDIGPFRIFSVFPADVRNYDTASRPIPIYAGENYLFVWTGGAVAVGATATATIISEVNDFGTQGVF